MPRIPARISCIPFFIFTFAVSSIAAEPERVAWVAAHAVPLATVEAGHGFADLAPLREMIGDARVVALGEGTHGTREHFQLKHRLVEYLATELGFTLFAIEANMPEAQDLDPYVRGGAGDAVDLIGGMYFWTWRTEEVLAMVEWMRAHNAAGGDLGFTGFDMQTPDMAMSRVVDFLATVDTAYAGEVRAAYDRLLGTKRRAFGCATMSFPVEAARGNHIRYSAWIRTADVRDGFAGLWWRIDGREPGEILGFDNMADRGPRGTTDWTEYAIEMDVPVGAAAIAFGAILPAQGVAWFDDLRVTLDGESYEDPLRFDFGYEGERILHYVSADDEYRGALDDANAHSGEQSLRLSHVGAPGDTTTAPADAVRIAADILARMIAEEGGWRLTRPEHEVAWAVQNARVVAQCMALKATDQTGDARDRSMADNVLWLLERNPAARVVLWAHNGHIARQPGRMGTFLAEALGDDYLPVGLTAGAGRYTAIGADSLGTHDLLPPPADSVEAVFAAVGEPLSMLDLREAPADEPGAGWLHEDPFMRSLGALASIWQFHRQPVTACYDLVMWVADTTPAVQLER